MDEFSNILKSRLRLENTLGKLKDSHHLVKSKLKQNDTSHIPGQPFCYCYECLIHRREDWRIGDMNEKVIGPRNQWSQLCWGNGERGSLGLARIQTPLGPTRCPQVLEDFEVVDIKKNRITIQREAKFIETKSGMYHTLMLSESNKLFACGDNSYHALGMELPEAFLLHPSEIREGFDIPGNIVDFATGAFTSYAIKDIPVSSDGVVHLKEMNEKLSNNKKLLGRTNDPIKQAKYCALIDDLEKQMNLIQASVKAEHSKDNNVLSWGRGCRGALGHGNIKHVTKPTIITALSSVRAVQISAGLQHVLVRTEMDGCYAFGKGENGRLGLGDAEDRYIPALIHELKNMHVVSVEAGGEHSMALIGAELNERQVYAWGKGENGRLGLKNCEDKYKPTRINRLRNQKIVKLSAGGAHSLAMSDPLLRKIGGNVVWSWGFGLYGQLGHRNNWDYHEPKVIDEFEKESFRAISAGERHSLALTIDGALWCWGHGVHGEQSDCLDPSSTTVLFPRKVYLNSIHVHSVCAGYGRTFVWGDKAVQKSNVEDHQGDAHSIEGSRGNM